MLESFRRPRLPLLVFVLSLLLVFAQAQDIQSLNESDHQCIHPSKQADPCTFVRTYCGSEGGLINYLELRYCTISSKNAVWFFVLVLFLTIAYFYALFRVSDVHLTTALQSISDYLGLSSEIAGLTLLSFGNGAPDLFTAFAGVSSGDFELIFGSTIGSAMFVLNVVLGSIIIASYYRHRNETLPLLQNAPLLTQTASPPDAEVEQPRSTSNSESFIRLRRKLQSITRALRFQPSHERCISNFVIQFKGNSVDRFSHLRNVSIYTIAVIMLLAIFNDGTVHWYDPVILLVYYIFFLAFFIGRHFYLERVSRKQKEANMKLNPSPSPSSSNSLFRGASFDSIRTFDNCLSPPEAIQPFLDIKSRSSIPPSGNLNIPAFTVPQLIVTPASDSTQEALDESISNSPSSAHHRNHLSRANKPNPIITTCFTERHLPSIPTIVIDAEDDEDLANMSDKDSEISFDEEFKFNLRHVIGLLKLHLFHDSEIVNSIQERFSFTKPTTVFQWVRLCAETFCGIFWMFMIPIRCLICLSMPPFLSDMISEVDDDIREEDEDHLEEIAMKSENPDEYAEDAVSTNIIRYTSTCDITESEKLIGAKGSKSLNPHTEPSPSRLLTVPVVDITNPIPPAYKHCSKQENSIRYVRPTSAQRTLRSAGVSSIHTGDLSTPRTISNRTQYMLVSESARSPDPRNLDYGTMSENVRKAPWWWPLPRKAMIRFIYHLTHVPVHRFLKYRVLLAVYPVVASLLVIYLAGFHMEPMSILAVSILAIVLIISGLLATRSIVAVAADFGRGFAEYLDAKSLLSPQTGCSFSRISPTANPLSPNQGLNGEHVSLSTDEKNIARYLKFLLMAYCRGVYSECNPCHIRFHTIKVASILYMYELLCSFITFVMSILWIYLVSNEIVALLASLGTILSLSKAILGLTVLAWGNSLGDLFADVAMARAGFFRVAVTAVWAGPIQNLLLTLGITLLIGCFQYKPAGVGLEGASIPLPAISPTIWLGFCFLLFSVVILSGVVLGIYYKFRLPLSLGVLLLANFAIYLTTTIFMEWRTEE